MSDLNYMDPDYTDVFMKRQRRLNELRENPQLLSAMKIYYRDNPWDFITDWGMTFDPRRLDDGLVPSVPFIMWPRQVDFLKWVMARWKDKEYGIVEKSRDCGVTWLVVALAVTLWLFVPGYSAGFGSAVEDKVDKKGDPDCIFEKIRFFLKNLPVEFMPEGYIERVHSGFMKLVNPANGASITGGCGDNIGRGGRKSQWYVDETAFIEHQLLVANSLSAATNCQIDISTYNGNGNLFYKNAMKFDGKPQKFIFDWRDDPRKDEIWYAKQVRDKDPITVAQEIDRDPNASATDTFIPSKWVKAAIDLHKLLRVPTTGFRVTSFDPADIGDAKAVVSRYGYVITAAETKLDGDITQAIPWAYELAFKHQSDQLIYDADGMGAPTMKLTLKNHAAGRIDVVPFYGSGKIFEPEKRYGEDPNNPDKTLKKNKDMFYNFRAQAATWMRDRFEASYNIRKQIESGQVAVGLNLDNIISIDSACINQFELVAELSRPRRVWDTTNGKIKVESKKDMKARGVDSPNLFDACMGAIAAKPAGFKSRRNIRSRSIRARDRGVGM